MSPLQTTRVAAKALMRNKTRSFLTTLGVIIGVFAVIAMVAIGDGAKARVEQTFSSIGSNMLVIVPGTSMRGGAMGGFGSLPTLTWDDLRAIKEEVPSVKYAAPTMRTVGQVQSEDENWTTSITGTAPDFFGIRTWAADQGSLFQQADVDAGAKAAVVGRTVVDNLYGKGANPVGRTMRIKGVPFLIVGVLEKKGQSAMGSDNDDAVFVPYSAYLSKIQAGALGNFVPGAIMVGARSENELDRTQLRITNLLRDRHRIAPGTDDDFSIRNLTEMAGAVESGAAALTALLAAIAAVSLVVGGIGIMNIMLVSVTERTREIGLRMAVGAKPRQVLAQFLVEAAVLSLAGGAIGIVFGVSTARIVAEQMSWPMSFRPDMIVVAVGFSALVGVGFGLYPALKASRLDPIDALRYE
jgi:putative ABC transport system permease protein